MVQQIREIVCLRTLRLYHFLQASSYCYRSWLPRSSGTSMSPNNGGCIVHPLSQQIHFSQKSGSCHDGHLYTWPSPCQRYAPRLSIFLPFQFNPVNCIHCILPCTQLHSSMQTMVLHPIFHLWTAHTYISCSAFVVAHLCRQSPE